MANPLFIVRHVPEYGWAAFDRSTGEKLEGNHFGPWWPRRNLAIAAAERKVAAETNAPEAI